MAAALQGLPPMPKSLSGLLSFTKESPLSSRQQQQQQQQQGTSQQQPEQQQQSHQRPLPSAPQFPTASSSASASLSSTASNAANVPPNQVTNDPTDPRKAKANASLLVGPKMEDPFLCPLMFLMGFSSLSFTYRSRSLAPQYDPFFSHVLTFWAFWQLFFAGCSPSVKLSIITLAYRRLLVAVAACVLEQRLLYLEWDGDGGCSAEPVLRGLLKTASSNDGIPDRRSWRRRQPAQR